MAIAEYASYDGLGLAELVRKGDVKAEELVEEAISRIERHNPALNAVVHPMYEMAREAAATPPASGQAGPFQGVPFVVKDLLASYRGVPNTSGSRLLEGIVADVDAELVVRYKRAGLIGVAKTNAPEFGIVPTTEPLLYGPTRNPWNTDHSVGGSSGGSAAVRAGWVLRSHGKRHGVQCRLKVEHDRHVDRLSVFRATDLQAPAADLIPAKQERVAD